MDGAVVMATSSIVKRVETEGTQMAKQLITAQQMKLLSLSLSTVSLQSNTENKRANICFPPP